MVLSMIMPITSPFSGVHADFHSALARYRVVDTVDFGGNPIRLHVNDVYLMSDDSEDMLLNIFNVDFACESSSYHQGPFSSSWCNENPFGECNSVDSFITIGGIGPHKTAPQNCQFAQSCSCNLFDPPSGNPPTGWYSSNPPGGCGSPVSTPLGDGVFIGRFSSLDPFTLHGSTLEATWNQGLGTPGKQGSFTIVNIDDADGDCVPDEDFVDCDVNGVPDEEDIAEDARLDCNQDGSIDFCDLGLEADPRYRVHDDSSEDVIGNDEAGTLVWFQHFESRSGLDVIRAVSIEFGIAGTGNDIDGLPAQVAIWSDPDGDGIPEDAELIAVDTITIQDYLSTGLQEHVFDSPVSIPKGMPFFVGALVDIRVNDYPATVDTSEGSSGSWVAFDPDGFSAADLRTIPAHRLSSINAKWQWRWMITASAVVDPGILDCNGTGALDECEIAAGTVLDCNENGIPDTCDIEDGVEDDVNLDGVPDACERREGDFNLDGCIDAADLGVLIALWGTRNPPFGDLDGDGVVGAADLGRFLGNWSPCDP